MHLSNPLADVLGLGEVYADQPTGYQCAVLALVLESLPPLTLGQMREIADARFRGFVAACRAEGFADEWAAYKSEEAGKAWPPILKAAHNLAMRDLHAFYGMRDGPGGVLGGRA